MSSPIPSTRLTEIANDACDSAFSSSQAYDHYSAESWNTHIINTILQQLLNETSSDEQPPRYKLAVNSTIMQHSTQSTAEGDMNLSGKRGMHSAAGAYWNSEKDGMWNFKYEKSESKGFDDLFSDHKRDMDLRGLINPFSWKKRHSHVSAIIGQRMIDLGEIWRIEELID